MISITFNGSAAEVLSDMQQLVAAHGVSPIGAETEDRPAPARRGRKAAEPAAQPEEGNAVAETAAPATATVAAPSQPVADAATLRDEVRTKGVKYGMPHNGGQGALKELIAQFGSTTGKLSGVPDEQLAGLGARLDELLVDAK